MTLFLIGFTGSGKTTLGKELASWFDRPFYDLDRYIEKKEGLSINEIFEFGQEAYFRLQEWRYLQDFYCNDKLVLATGGGTPCFHNNMRDMNKNGLTIFLDTKEGTILSRLHKQRDQRPLVRGLTHSDLKSYISQTLKQRRRFYEDADLITDPEKESVSQLGKRITHLNKRL